MRCVHCNGPGIHSGAKRWSSREAPATCALCGKLSHVIASTGSGIPAATALIVVVFAILGTFIDNPLVTAIIGLPFAVAYNIWAWRIAEMFPIFPQVSVRARKVSWLVNLLAVLGIFGS